VWHSSLTGNWSRVHTGLLVLAVLLASALAGIRPSPYVLVLLVGAGGMVLLLREPAWGLVAMATLSFTLPLEVGTGGDVAITPPVLLIAAVIGVWLVDSLRRRSLRLPASRTTLPLLLFTGSGLLSLLAGTAYWDPQIPRADNLLLVQLAQWAIFAFSAAIFLMAAC
jgi:hypothetical protein